MEPYQDVKLQFFGVQLFIHHYAVRELRLELHVATSLEFQHKQFGGSFHRLFVSDVDEGGIQGLGPVRMKPVSGC